VALAGVEVLLPQPAPTDATAQRSLLRPSLDAPVLKTDTVVLRGHARARATVRIQTRAGTSWRSRTSVRAGRTGRFKATIPAPKRRQYVRALVARRASQVRTVVPPPPPPTPLGTVAPGAAAPAVAAPAGVSDAGAPVDACGPEPLKADGTYWRCTFVDDFTGTSLDPRWVASQIPGNGGDLCYASSAQTIAVSEGELRLTVLPTGTGTVCPARADGTRASYAGASISTWHTFGQQYGRFEARIRVPVVNGPGLHSAFWLWPDTRSTSDADWPRTGEIDIAELYSGYPNLVIPFLHYVEDLLGSVEGLNTTTTATSQRGVWHTYTLIWSADRLDIYVDSHRILTNTLGAANFRKPFILNFSQLLGQGLNAWNGKVPLPSSMEVDYVKVWQ
jgi:beta-glucanase (GH16 family)